MLLSLKQVCYTISIKYEAKPQIAIDLTWWKLQWSDKCHSRYSFVYLSIYRRNFSHSYYNTHLCKIMLSELISCHHKSIFKNILLQNIPRKYLYRVTNLRFLLKPSFSILTKAEEYSSLCEICIMEIGTKIQRCFKVVLKLVLRRYQ